MKFICENRDGKVCVRGPCCVDSKGELREDYTGWIIEDLDIPNPNVLADEDGRLLYRVIDHRAVTEKSELTEKEKKAKALASITKEDLIKRIEVLEARSIK